MNRGENGFSIAEVTVALAVTLMISAAVFGLLNPVEGAFSVEPEKADMQQRLRAGTDTLFGNLLMAGAGASFGKWSGGLYAVFAPVLPFRRGAVGDAAPGSFTTDTITVLYVPPMAAEATTTAPVVAAHAALRVDGDAGCRSMNAGRAPQPLCGFEPGMSVLIVDDGGRYDVFTVVGVDGDTARLDVNKPVGSAATVYPAASNVVEVVDRTYSLRVDPARKAYQLVSYDGSNRPDMPVVDNVVGLTFEYFGDPQPPVLEESDNSAIDPRASYGPNPPPRGVKGTAFPEGENCTFSRDDTGNAVPRLTVLSDSSSPLALVKLAAAQLTDGPWCPDAFSADRFDADLLRIRAIAVTLRVQAAIDALRGPASALFFNSGSARSASRWIPDQEIRFVVVPRNMSLGR